MPSARAAASCAASPRAGVHRHARARGRKAMSIIDGKHFFRLPDARTRWAFFIIILAHGIHKSILLNAYRVSSQSRNRCAAAAHASRAQHRVALRSRLPLAPVCWKERTSSVETERYPGRPPAPSNENRSRVPRLMLTHNTGAKLETAMSLHGPRNKGLTRERESSRRAGCGCELRVYHR
jgi:hypothetical protein